MNDISKTFCILPWVHLYMNPDGQIFPCCRLGGEESLGNIEEGLEKVWLSEKFSHMRKQLLAGEKSSYCTQCYREEECGSRSMREKVNKRFSHHIPQANGPLPSLKLSWIDVRFSNLCNYKCLSCGPHLSSAWNEGVVVRPSTDVLKEISTHVDSLEAIYFAGGEPLLMREHYEVLKLLISKGKTNTHLSYNTNLSLLEFQGQDLIELWQQFENVELWVSLDGAGKIGENIRENMSWAKTTENFFLVKKKCPHIKMVVTCTLSRLNAKHLPDFHYECLKLGMIDEGECFTINILHNPQELALKSLPRAEKDVLIKQYRDYMASRLSERDDDYAHFTNIIKFLID